jgi:tetratricopeptide (TPR) repeat protein
MQLVDRPNRLASSLPILSAANQQELERLKLLLGLRLRRQVVLAVCDDLALRDWLVAQLCQQPTSGSTAASSHSMFSRTPVNAGEPGGMAPLNHGTESADAGQRLEVVTLPLNLDFPDPLDQIFRWFAQNTLSYHSQSASRNWIFQIVGIEHLTRKSGTIQQQFLHSLQQLDMHPKGLDSSLILWLPRPWLRVIQQSASAFWNRHTALFQFEGDPTPSPLFRTPVGNGSQGARLTPPVPLATAPTQPASPSTARLNQLTQRVVESEHLSPPVGQETLWNQPSTAEPQTESVALTGLAAGGDRPTVTVKEVPSDRPAQNRIQQDEGSLHSSPPNGGATVPELSETLASETDSVPASAKSPRVAVMARDDRLHAALALSDLILSMAEQTTDTTVARRYAPIFARLEEIERLHEQQAAPEVLANSYHRLATQYRDFIEKGDSHPATLEIAIRAYELTLAWLEPSAPLQADVLNDLGNLHWMRSRCSATADQALGCLEAGVAAYEQALQRVNPKERPQTYAMIQNNLGAVWGDLARYRDPITSLQRSVKAYEAALRYRKIGDDPGRYAATQNNLGTTYWNLAQHQHPVSYLNRAVDAYREALIYYTPEREPLKYAMIQNNLGTALWNLSQCEQLASLKQTSISKLDLQRELLQRAIAAYQEALVYRTVEVVPTAHAATQNNLGAAYWHLAMLASTASVERQQYLQAAIAAYTQALNAVQQLAERGASGLTFDPLATQNNLGLAYYHLAKHPQTEKGQRISFLDASLNHHRQAIQASGLTSDIKELTLSYLVQTIRAIHDITGITGQTQALSKVPAQLLPELMKRL